MVLNSFHIISSEDGTILLSRYFDRSGSRSEFDEGPFFEQRLLHNLVMAECGRSDRQFCRIGDSISVCFQQIDSMIIALSGASDIDEITLSDLLG